MKFQLVINMSRDSADTDMADVARHTLEMVQMADDGGFESVWAAEHHGVEIYVAPNPFQILTWFAAHTSRIRLGAAVAVAAFWHPIKLAEEAALVDLYSQGRLDLGVGSGALQCEFDRIRPGATQANGYRYVQEILPAVRALWAGDYAHDGELWSFPTATAVPKPVQTPHPPLWVAARSPVTFDFAVEHGCNVMTWALNRPFAEVELYMQRFESALERSPGTERPVFASMRHTAVMEDERGLDDVVAAVHRQSAKLETLRGEAPDVSNGFVQSFNEDGIKARDEFGRDELLQNLMVGTPEQIVSKLRQYEALGVDQYTYNASFGLDPSQQTRSLELFIDEVMPHFAAAPGSPRDRRVAVASE